VDGTDNFDFGFGFTELETAGASIVRDAGVDRIIQEARKSECNTGASAFGNISLDGHVTVLKIIVIRTVMDWNGEIAQ
jgi:hypothetical protein